VPRASLAERERLLEDFVRLCEIESPSGREREVADVVAADLHALGLDVEEDRSGADTRSDAGNLLARVPGPGGTRPIMLAAHLDTVPLEAPVEVERSEGVLRNRHHGVLGADNKAAVAALLGVARRIVRAGAPVALELLFTTCEEQALAGAKALDRSRLRAEIGFVFDHASPIGELIVAAPTYYRVEADFHGQAAHAGIRPEEGRNAIAAAAAAIAAVDLGRIEQETTTNVGRIEGGTAANVVAERCRVELEARSLDPAKAAATVSGIVDAMTKAASESQCDLVTAVDEGFRGYRLPRSSEVVQIGVAALASLGIEPSFVATGGGSDANVFCARGLPCLNLANGTERNHEPDEHVTVEALETGLDLALAVVAASA
jgi:tripeptide aminopeptidase